MDEHIKFLKEMITEQYKIIGYAQQGRKDYPDDAFWNHSIRKSEERISLLIDIIGVLYRIERSTLDGRDSKDIIE
jgi:hypothetical protein